MFQYKGTSLLNFIIVSIYYAVSVIKRSSVRPSVCPVDRQQQRRPVGLLLGPDVSNRLADSCCCRATRGPRKFWPDCKEVQTTWCVTDSAGGDGYW